MNYLTKEAIKLVIYRRLDDRQETQIREIQLIGPNRLNRFRAKNGLGIPVIAMIRYNFFYSLWSNCVRKNRLSIALRDPTEDLAVPNLEEDGCTEPTMLLENFLTRGLIISEVNSDACVPIRRRKLSEGYQWYSSDHRLA